MEERAWVAGVCQIGRRVHMKGGKDRIMGEVEGWSSGLKLVARGCRRERKSRNGREEGDRSPKTMSWKCIGADVERNVEQLYVYVHGPFSSTSDLSSILLLPSSTPAASSPALPASC